MMRFPVILLLSLFLSVSLADEDCNGRGMYYPDTQMCECYPCASGDQCEVVPDSCNVTAMGGNPLLFQEYWSNPKLNNFEETQTLVQADYRTGYPPVVGGIQKVLFPTIQKLHELYGNANATGRHIILGGGCTQLIHAVSYAFSITAKNQKTIFAQAPYYDGYAIAADLDPARLVFNDSLNQEDNKDIIEFVTYPNNPDGKWRSPVYDNSHYVYDSVYYWHSLVDVEVMLDVPIVLFSMSKATGHAGSRLGWALVKDPIVALHMTDYIQKNTIGISVEAQYRTYTILQSLINNPYHFFDYIKAKLRVRWEEMDKVFAEAPDRFALHSTPGTFYQWVQCLYPDEAQNCVGVFSDAGIIGESGVPFGSTNAYTRLEVVQQDFTWGYFMANLKALVASS